MASGTALARGVAAGIVGWTAAEYAVHRWLMHGRPRPNPVTSEHLEHHRHPDDARPLAVDRFLLWPLAGGLVVAGPTAVLASGPVAVGAGVGFAGSYCWYRHQHWLIHHRAPRTRWGRRLRRHHLRHHVGAPRANHGVTTPVWDRLLGTGADRPGPVPLPAHLAPDWLRDEGGRLRPEHAADFSLR